MAQKVIICRLMHIVHHIYVNKKTQKDSVILSSYLIAISTTAEISFSKICALQLLVHAYIVHNVLNADWIHSLRNIANIIPMGGAAEIKKDYCLNLKLHANCQENSTTINS